MKPGYTIAHLVNLILMIVLVKAYQSIPAVAMATFSAAKLVGQVIKWICIPIDRWEEKEKRRIL